MKTQINFKKAIYYLFITAVVIILQSCIVQQPYTSRIVTVHDIVQMSKDGVSSKDIIREIRKTHTAYNLKADQLAKLRDEGVQDSVINYMEKTHIDAIRRNQQMEDSFYWWPGYYRYLYGGFGYGWPLYGGFWGRGPTFYFRGHGEGFHGRYHGGGSHSGGRR
jgi:hypothetical protein